MNGKHLQGRLARRWNDDVSGVMTSVAGENLAQSAACCCASECWQMIMGEESSRCHWT